MNRNLLLLVIVITLIVSTTLIAVNQLQGRTAPTYSADVVAALSSGDTSGFARALEVREFKFPQDHAAHPEFQTEWWYYTGNLTTDEGRRFGFQFTIFRRAITPTLPERKSDWATNQVYFAHFAVSDIGDNQFFAKELFSRGAAGLAGVTLDPKLRVWIQNWQIAAQDVDAKTVQVKASEGDIAIDLTMEQIKSIALQGDRGLSPKSAEPGNASYYYSLTRLPTKGTVTVKGKAYTVSGNSWLDREWSTSVLRKDAAGWDWFALQLDNQREIMLYYIRLKNGGVEPVSHGIFVEADGSTHPLKLQDFKIEAINHWTSPHSGAVYPSGWRVNINVPSGPIQLEITPLMQDQELNFAVTAYWEGASHITGTDNGQPVTGYGYVELTGYNSAVSDSQENDNKSEQITR
jgi:predicted secreted hydrolase